MIEFVMESFRWMLDLPYGRELLSFSISMLPLIELRGGLPVAIALGLNPIYALIICFLGNLLPVPFIIWLITPIFNYLKEFKIFKGIVENLEAKADMKKDKIEKYEFWGLLLFVAIPMPGTGAWTGSLIAALLDMNKQKSLLAATLGILLAGIIMLSGSLLVKGLFF
ncbi:MAG: COG2426 family protein [Erysipelotrichaceae bacterium]